MLGFIKSKKHAVISTCGSSMQPESALISFGETENLELIFRTFKTTRKYKNLKENNKVAFIIGWDEEAITVQYEGIAEELREPELEKHASLYYKKIPSASVFRVRDQSYWKVKPTWIRYSNLGGEKEEIFEYSFT